MPTTQKHNAPLSPGVQFSPSSPSVVEEMGVLPRLPSPLTLDEDDIEIQDVKIRGWTPINGKKRMVKPPKSTRPREQTPKGSLVITTQSSDALHSTASSSPHASPKDLAPASNKHKADAEAVDADAPKPKKRLREKGKGERILDGGILALSPCTNCLRLGKTCMVPKDPKEMATFKCGACIKGQIRCSLSALNPGRDDYDTEYVQKCARRLENSKKMERRAVRASPETRSVDLAQDVLVPSAPPEDARQRVSFRVSLPTSRSHRTPLPTRRQKKIVMAS